MQNQQLKPKLRLRVTTSNGLNLMCAASRGLRVGELAPHIAGIYEEIVSDQPANGNSHVIHVTRIDKDGFRVPFSEIVGDIFDDNEEILCHIETVSLQATKKIKKKKKNNPLVKDNKPDGDKPKKTEELVAKEDVAKNQQASQASQRAKPEPILDKHRKNKRKEKLEPSIVNKQRIQQTMSILLSKMV